MWLPEAWLLTAVLALAGAGGAPPPADARLQARIDEAVMAVAGGHDDAASRLEALRQMGRADGDARGALLLQLALYLEKATGTEQSMAGALVFQELAFSPAEKLDAILPHLGQAGPGLRRVFTEMLATIDRPGGGGPDFRLYEQALRARPEHPPAALVLYMFEVSADAALTSLDRVFGGAAPSPEASSRAIATLRELLPPPAGMAAGLPSAPGGEPLARGRAAVETLARDAAWWRRLHAALVLRAHPELSSPGLASRLAADPHPLVRQAALTVPSDPR